MPMHSIYLYFYLVEKILMRPPHVSLALTLVNVYVDLMVFTRIKLPVLYRSEVVDVGVDTI